MLAVTSNTITSKLQEYFDKVCDQAETVFVTREEEKNVVIISEDKYNAMLREINNAKFLEKLDCSEQEFQNGDVITMTLEELKGLKDA
ncbi:MAG: type II toxin-antitoxin system Phd/YefM family antitoxin [Eubacteriales bacterium]